jgi:xylan 1,4-beta-xylosidase
VSTTPIIPGFHPDPSICRVGDEYFIANSSFEYAPGVPIWRSADLLEWTLVGNALTRASQLTPSRGAANSGIYAPTLRHHDGRFWLVTTNVEEVQRGHLIVSAVDPAGPWSDPVHVRGTVGIDPDLFWDEDGVCHLTWASFLPTLHGVASAPIDPTTGEFLAEPALLWPGTGMAAPEGPHLYRREGWWYLLLAEGGTERGHAVTVARARELDGPWEPAPHNPILSHRSLDHPVQNTGHGDLVQLSDGSWAMAHLGVRPRGQTPRFHTNGRETFLVGIDWVDGWPVVDEGRFEPAPVDRSFTEDFSSDALHPRWVSPGAAPERFASRRDGRLLLTADADDPAPTLLAFRAVDTAWTAEATLRDLTGRVRFQVRMDEAHWYGVTVGEDAVDASVRIGPAETTFAAVSRDSASPVTVRIRAQEPAAQPFRPAAEVDIVSLALVLPDGTEHVFAEMDGRYLSTEVVGGFTGRTIGVEVLDGEAVVERIAYRSGADERA